MSKRVKVDGHAGVYYRIADRISGNGEEKVYYVVYKKDGKVIEAKAGRQYKDAMTPAKASLYRSRLIEGKEQNNQEKREAKKAEKQILTIDSLWNKYTAQLPNGPNRTDKSFYNKYLFKTFGSKQPSELPESVTPGLHLVSRLEPTSN